MSTIDPQDIEDPPQEFMDAADHGSPHQPESRAMTTDIVPFLTPEPASVSQIASRAKATESDVWEAIRCWECESVATADGMRYRKRPIATGRMVRYVPDYQDAASPNMTSGYGKYREVT